MSNLVIPIPYGTPRHQTILDAIMARRKISFDTMSKRYTKFKESDEQFLAYIPEKETDALKRAKRQSGEPQYTTIEVPYSYAILMTMHTYITSVFLSRSPVLQFTGRHGETEDKVRCVEAIMDYQTLVGEHLVPYYIWLLDALKYGLGTVGTYWAEEYEYVSQIIETPKTWFGFPIGGAPVRQRVTSKVPGYAGNRIYNVRPQDFFPDPRVPIVSLQKGEFCGREVEVSWNTILKKEAEKEYYNVERLRIEGETAASQRRESGSSQAPLPDTTAQIIDANADQRLRDNKNMGFTKLLEMYIELSPSDWGLGKTKYPEKWVFTVANDKVILSARPYGMNHGRFPFATYEPDVSGYSQMNRGTLEILKPLNDVMTWLVNSHFYNVRKHLNNELLVDPSRVEMADLLNPGPGRLLRAKPAAYGTDLRTAVHQLQVVDVTKTHIQDMRFIAEIMQRVVGVNDNIMGMLMQGGRRTATDARQSTTFGVNRMRSASEMASAQAFGPLAQIMLQSTQQNYDMEKSFRIAGQLALETSPWLPVKPEDILGFFDYVPIDGTMPVDKFALASIWKDLMKEAATQPAIMQQYDLTKIFAYVAQLAGAKNINQFKIKTVADGMLQAQVQAGNVVPLGGSGGNTGTRGAGAPGGAGNPDRPPIPRQVPGMGPAA